MDRDQVFISYTHADRAIAERLGCVLLGYGFSVWWDHALLGGDDFRARIARKIYEADVVLVLFSERSIQSGWVLDEAGRADQASKLVPVRIDNVEVPLGFGHLQRCDLIDWQEHAEHAALENILQAVERFTHQKRSETYVAPDVQTLSSATSVHRRMAWDRFAIAWWPDVSLRRVLLPLSLIYLLALMVAFMMKGPRAAFKEWVTLLHVYSGMVTLGGGIFLSLVFRLGDRAPAPGERAAVADVARSLYGGWRIAALAQLLTGLLLIVNSDKYLLAWPGWLVQSIILYLFALYLWWIGFGHALRAAKYDTLYQVGEYINDYRRLRDRRLLLAILLTAWVLISMIYQQDADLGDLFQRLF
ncbi:MAG: toll/interleukin-1 receptor domain-containing protein [Thiolinea sp.]